VWEYPVSHNHYPRSYPLVNVNLGQRNVQPNYNNCHLVGGYHAQHASMGIWDVDLFEDLAQDVYSDDTFEVPKDFTTQMEADPCLPESVFYGEEPVERVGNVNFSFAESFFANPFAVSFPGDLPCPNGPIMDDLSLEASPPATHTPSPFPPADSVKQIMSPQTTSSTPSTLNGGIVKSKKTAVRAGTANYGPQIHFVDMADKKGAQRIRNTMNSRKNRENKLDKIRELEKKLAELEAEREMWQKGATNGHSKA